MREIACNSVIYSVSPSNFLRVVLGAFNAFYRDMRLSQQFLVSRTFFLEDIECDEMHMYGDYVEDMIKKGVDTRAINHPITWSGNNINVIAVRVGGVWGDKVNAPVFGFAFCKEGTTKPFALTGMRHHVYYHMKINTGGVEPPPYDDVYGVPCFRNQYGIHKVRNLRGIFAF